MIEFSSGVIAIQMTICYVNFLSHDVTTNLYELKEQISELETSNEKWQTITIQRINSFEGFDGHGFFILGKVVDEKVAQ